MDRERIAADSPGGRDDGETMGRHHRRRLIPSILRSFRAHPQQGSRRGARIFSLKLADALHWFMARAIPVVASDSGERTIRVLVQDVTRLRKTEAHSRKMESLLAHTQEIAKVGSWEYDTERRTFLWSARRGATLSYRVGGALGTARRKCPHPAHARVASAQQRGRIAAHDWHHRRRHRPHRA